jgi:hypothetical protein
MADTVVVTSPDASAAVLTPTLTDAIAAALGYAASALASQTSATASASSAATSATVATNAAQSAISSNATALQSINAAITTALATAVSPPFTIVSAAVSAVAGSRLIADTRTGSFIITLPASPALGARVQLSDGYSSWATNNLIINPGINNIDGSAGTLVCDVAGASFGLGFMGSTIGWRLFQNGPSTYAPPSPYARLGRREILDADTVLAATDAGAVLKTLTATRTITLPSVSLMQPFQPFPIADGSGNASPSMRIVIQANGIDAIGIGTSISIQNAKGLIVLFPDGESSWLTQF